MKQIIKNKTTGISFRVTNEFRDEIEEFCILNNITLTNLFNAFMPTKKNITRLGLSKKQISSALHELFVEEIMNQKQKQIQLLKNRRAKRNKYLKSNSYAEAAIIKQISPKIPKEIVALKKIHLDAKRKIKKLKNKSHEKPIARRINK